MTVERERFAHIKEQIGRRAYDNAVRALRALVTPRADFTVQARAARLIASVPADKLGLKPIRIALIGSSTLEQFTDLLRLWLALDGLAAEFLDRAVRHGCADGARTFR